MSSPSVVSGAPSGALAGSANLNPLLVDPMDETLPSRCGECALEYPFYGLLERHRVDVHGADEVLVCGRCATGFKRKTNLVLHWRSTAHRLIKLVGCDVCDAFNVSNGFPDEENLADHTAEVHGEVNGRKEIDHLAGAI